MLHVLLATFPFFALILAGYVAARGGLLRLEAIPGLNGFVLYFALPCMLFRFGAGAPIAELLDGTVALVYLLCACAMVGLALRPETLVTLVRIAALPSASNVSMLAERFGANNGHIARIILVSTMIAFFSFPALVSMVAGTR